MIIILMFICICNAITERQVQVAVAAGATTLSDLQAQLGVAACCGCCADTAHEYLPGGRHARQVAGEQPLTAVVAAPAANDTGVPVRPMIEVVARRA